MYVLNTMLQAALAFALLGYLFSARKFISFLNSLTPTQGLIFYYFQLFVTLEVLQTLGLVVRGIKIASTMQTVGELFVIFAFFILVDQESRWIQVVVGEETKQEQRCPQLYLQSEDGATFEFWSNWFAPDTARILTFVVTPAILVAIGTYLMGFKRIQRSLLA